MGGKQYHILIVDDEELEVNTMSLVLRISRYKVSGASNGLEALNVIMREYASSAPIDLVITDLQMPQLGGEEFIDKLHLLDIDIPVIVITGFGDKETVVSLLRKGCADFIDKPIREDELLARVKDVLVRWEASRNEVKDWVDEKTFSQRTKIIKALHRRLLEKT